MNDTRVLVVDDEKEFVDTLTERLMLRGFEVDQAYTGDEALEKIMNRDYDVMVLDVRMPGRSGIETLREVRKERPLLSVLMLTGHATVETAIEGMKLGAMDYLLKPTETKDLVEKIEVASKLKREHEDRIRQAEIQNTLKKRGW